MLNITQPNLPVFNPVDFSDFDRQKIDFSQINLFDSDDTHYRFYLLDEISEGKAKQYRLSMANVLASVSQNQSALVYLLSGNPEGIRLYVGVAGKNYNTSEDGKVLKSAFEGNFLGAKLTELKSDDDQVAALFSNMKHIGLVTGVPSFNDEAQSLNGEEFQGIERLAKTLNDASWQLIVVAEPGSEDEIRESLSQIYDFSTELSGQIKHSIQQSENISWNASGTAGESNSNTHGTSETNTNSKNKGTSETKGDSKGSNSGGSSSSTNSGTSTSRTTNDGMSESTAKGTSDSKTEGESQSSTKGISGSNALSLTKERINKHIEQIQNHLTENQMSRFQAGLGKGMFKTAVYICAENHTTYKRLAGSVKSIFQGNQSTLAPLHVSKIDVSQITLPNLLDLKTITTSIDDAPATQSAMVYSIPKIGHQMYLGATWLNTNELALLTGLPCEELPGLKLRKNVNFALNTLDEDAHQNVLKLGKIIHDGRILPAKKVQLSSESLNKHVFVTGVTGAGKTTTCMKLLLESGLPFMVVEPAKTEYRALYGQVQDIQYYCLGREDLTTFRLNPFELVSKHQNRLCRIKEHTLISMVIAM